MRRLLYAAWAVAFALGLWGLWQRLTLGHQLAGYGSYIVWGLWVSLYIYLVGLSAGAFLLSSLVYVFNMQRLERMGKLALFVALVTLLTALLAIWFDLGHMSRFYKVFTTPNFGSMMAWMIWLYTAYFILLVIETYFVFRPDLVRWSNDPSISAVRRRLTGWLTLGLTDLSPEALDRERRTIRILATIGLPLAIGFSGGVGALFATVSSKAYWHQSLVPILFLTGALASGGGLLTAAVASLWRIRDQAYQDLVALLGRIVLGLVLLDVVLEWAEFSIPLWYGATPEGHMLREVLFGPFWWMFWLVHLSLGTIVPLALIGFRGRSPAAVGAGGLLVALTFMAVRLNIVIPAQIHPSFTGLERAFTGARLVFAYVPTLHEWLLSLFVVAVGVGLFWIGCRLLPLLEMKKEVSR